MGEIELTRAVPIAEQGEGTSQEEQRIFSWMFASRESSRFEPDGLLLYFELALPDSTDVQAEIDMDTSGGRDAVVHYNETRDGQILFESDAAVGVVELARDLDGLPCACADGRMELRLFDYGADGQPGTADDAVRELREGRYGWRDLHCGRSLPDADFALGELTRVRVQPVDHCLGQTPEGRASDDLAEGVLEARDERAYEHEHVDVVHEPYEPHSHVVYYENQGCGSRTRDEDTQSAGCGSGPSSESASAGGGGCQGDDVDDDRSTGCAGDDAQSDSAGCEGDSADDGCGGDVEHARALRRMRRSPLSGPLQNYLWFGFATLWTTVRAKRLGKGLKFRHSSPS